MSGEIEATRRAITEALNDADAALNLTNQLPSLHEAIFDASISTHRSLEASASGLSRFLQKSSLAEEALGTERIESVPGRLAAAHENREAAIEAGEETTLELGLALTGFITIASRLKEMRARFDGESGARELLKKAAKTAEAALLEGNAFPKQLTTSMSYAVMLSSQHRLTIETAGFGEKSLPDITERLKDAVMLLVDRKDTSIYTLSAILKAVQAKVTQKDLKEVIQLMECISETKGTYTFDTPKQQRKLQENIQTAIQLGTQLQSTI